MVGYATETAGARNLTTMQAAGWRLLLTPDTLRWSKWSAAKPPTWPDGTPARYVLDNGAFGCWTAGIPWDADRFRACYNAVGAGAEWTVVPDIVGAGAKSLSLSLSWLPRLAGNVLIPVQDGMEAEDVAPHVGGRVGIFVGGTTAWKVQMLRTWGNVAIETGAYLHVGRVNSARRIAMCGAAGAHSFDGTSTTRYSKTMPRLDAARRRYNLFTKAHPWEA
jgi:hypothetical protein